jgi:PAS domain S-box-containing protein
MSQDEGPRLADDKDQTRLLWAVVNTAVDGVILIDAGGIVRMFNPACERLFGYGATEVVGENVKMLMPTPFHAEHDRYLDNYARTGVRKIIGIGREVVGRRKDGSTFPMELSVGEAEEDGAPIFVGVIHDLTERIRSQRDIGEVLSRLRAVVDTAVDGVILIDASGFVLMFNPACERLFGYAASEVIGQNVKLLMPPPFHEQHDRFLDNYHRTGERKIIGIGREVVGRRKDGSTFPMDLSVGEAKQEGASIFVGIIHDLTGRKRTEEQLVQAQKMETVGQLSGGIAHDFNNLLTVIIGNAEVLGERLKARPDLKQLCDGILNAGDRGAQLTQRLLAFSRRQTLQPVMFDCNRLVEGMQQLLKGALREDVDIRTSLDPDILPTFADPAQLESAILNLSLNAQDAMQAGGSLTIATAGASLDQLYVDAHPEVKAGPYVMISVTDTGTGMPPEVRERAFEPFFTTKDVGKGSGLGLSMVYGFAKQSNGHVAIYSELGLGTTVRIYLPALATPSSDSAAAGISTTEDAPLGSETVMLVEDDPFVRGYAVACLEALGYRVVMAADGRDALALLAKGATPDVLFSDVVMPGGLSGWELAERARAMQPGLRILLTSGYPMDSMAPRSAHPLQAALLNKPYRKMDLARRLRALLNAPL